MEKRKILVVDDEVNIVELLRINLKSAGYEVISAYTGEEAVDKTFKEHPDLILLDLMLPGIDGLETFRRIKMEKSTTRIPVIMLTAKSEETDKVVGLEIGADDYITKPFGVRELIARVKAVLRRVDEKYIVINEVKKEENAEPKVLNIHDITIDVESHIVMKDKVVCDLTLTEFKLLKVLAENLNKVVTREYIAKEIFGENFESDIRTIDVHIRNLRKKLSDSQDESGYIKTIRGVGYKMI